MRSLFFDCAIAVSEFIDALSVVLRNGKQNKREADESKYEVYHCSSSIIAIIAWANTKADTKPAKNAKVQVITRPPRLDRNTRTHRPHHTVW
jgi:hypothetical protein